MKKLVFALLMSLFALACALPIEPSTDSDAESDEPEVDGIKQDVWCFGFPYKTMAFPLSQGPWRGDGAGQVMVAPFWNGNCQPAGTEFGYGQEDGEINLIQNVGWSPSTCWTWKNSATSGIVCNDQAYQCPANACLTEPVTWQLEPTAPNNTINWGWSQWSAIPSSQSAAPGNHGIWPKAPSQCSNGTATPQFNPNGQGGSLLSCRYAMGTYWLKQF